MKDDYDAIPSATPGEAPDTQSMKRGLQTRHLAMIALGGAIGTGLFLTSGGALSASGPGGALIAMGVIGVLVFLLMQCLGELATFCPCTGSYSAFSERFVDPALGFASGWTEFIGRSFSLAIEVLTSGILVRFWLPNFPSWVTEISIYVLLFLVNAFTVKGYGELEFWMCGMKMVAIIAFNIVGILRIFGAWGKPVYFEYFVYGQGPVMGGIEGILSSLIVAAFSFLGTEMVGLTAAESANPSHDIPVAIRFVILRVLVCYLLSMLVVGCLLKYDDPTLLGGGSDKSAASPFTMVLKSANVPGGPHIMNALILASVVSSGNAETYSSSRMLYSLAVNGKAPQIFGRTSGAGIPFWALLAVIGCSLVVYATAKIEESFYVILVQSLTVGGFISWFVIAISHFRFRLAFNAQGHSLSELRYYASGFPFAQIFILVVCIFMAFCHSLEEAKTGKWFEFALTYFSLICSAGFYFIYKFLKKTKIHRLTEISLKAPVLGGTKLVATEESETGPSIQLDLI